jgi:hypothetical protein
VDLSILALELLADIPEAERASALREWVASMCRIYDSKKTPRPSWLRKMVRAVAADPADPAAPETLPG